MIKRFISVLSTILILSILSGMLIGFLVLFLSYQTYAIATIIFILIIAIASTFRELREEDE